MAANDIRQRIVHVEEKDNVVAMIGRNSSMEEFPLSHVMQNFMYRTCRCFDDVDNALGRLSISSQTISSQDIPSTVLYQQKIT